MRRVIKWILHALFGAYDAYWVFRFELEERGPTVEADPDARALTAEQIAVLPEPLQARASYAGPGAVALGIWCDGKLAAVSWAWSHSRYEGPIWSIGPGEAFVMDLFTLPEFRGRGLGTRLMRAIARHLWELRYERAFCTVWWTHKTSVFMTERAGWRKEAVVFRIFPFGLRWPLRLRWRVRGSGPPAVVPQRSH